MAVGVCLTAINARAQDATWKVAPATNDWNTATNWTPATVPTGTAIFGASGTTSIGINSSISIGTIQLNAGAPAYTFTGIGLVAIDITGAGFVNNSSFAPTLINQFITFHNSSSAGNANITNPAGIFTFQDNSTAANSTIDNEATLQFLNAATAGNATILNNDTLEFFNTTTASTATVTNNGTMRFNDASSAGNSVIINNVGNALFFLNTSTAANATITTNVGGVVEFQDTASGGTARFITNAGGSFDISQLASAGTTAGSIEGAGTYSLGAKNLTVGGNNLSTTVSGTIADGGLGGGVGGSLTKVGAGTLILSGVNTYTGATIVSGGRLQVDGSIATSPLTTITAGGTLLGSGTVGSVTVAAGGIFAPGPPSGPGAMTVAGNLAVLPGGVYAVQVNATGASIANVTGSATLTGGSVQAAVSGVGVHPFSVNILHAAGGLGGSTFGSASALPLYSATVTYTGTDAILNLAPAFVAQVGWIAATQQQQSFSQLDVVIEHIRDRLQKPQCRNADDAPIPCPNSEGTGSTSNARFARNEQGPVASAYTAYAQAPGTAAPAPQAPAWGNWVQAMEDWQRNSAMSSTDTAHTTRTTSGQGGFDLTWRSLLTAEDAFVLGLVASDTTSAVASAVAYVGSPTSSRMRGPGVGTYATYINGGFSTDMTAKFDFLGMTQSFGGLAPDVSFGIVNAGLSGNVQYKFFPDKNDRFIEPTAGFAYTHTMFNGAAVPVLGLKDSNTVLVQAGARIGGSWKVNDISIDANLKSLVYSNVFVQASSGAAAALSALTPTDQGLLRGEIDPDICFNLADGYSITFSGQVRFGAAIVEGSAALNIRKQW